jgi:hypothetical protein
MDRWKYRVAKIVEADCESMGPLSFANTKPDKLIEASSNWALSVIKESGLLPPEPTDLELEVHNIASGVVQGYIDQYLPVNGNGIHLPDLPANIDPELILKPLGIGALYQLYEDWQKVPWVWQGILPHGSLSLLVGKSESGKSTFVYALIYAIVRGLDFLGRACEPGRVLYLAGDPASELVAAQTFKALGLEASESVLTIRDALVGNPYAWPQFRKIVADFQPTLIVLDTLAAAINLSTEQYAQAVQSQQPLSKLARDFNPNILSLHHSQKAAVDAYNVVDAALGSVGVAAVASTRMVTRLYKRGKTDYHTFEMSNLRIGQPIQGEWIMIKLENGLIELGGLWSERDSNLLEEVILKIVGDANGEPVTQSHIRDLLAGMRINRGVLARKLAEMSRGTAKRIERVGKKGKQYILAAPDLFPSEGRDE